MRGGRCGGYARRLSDPKDYPFIAEIARDEQGHSTRSSPAPLVVFVAAFLWFFVMGDRAAYCEVPSSKLESVDGSTSGLMIRDVRTNGGTSSDGEEDQRPYLNAVSETRLRALVGVPLFLFGVWLIYYSNKAIDHDLGWRDWLWFASACLCISSSFVLLFYRASLSTLWHLL